jgi:O-acetyl-ADP-ribose deacetylase (regulator of RNase III)
VEQKAGGRHLQVAHGDCVTLVRLHGTRYITPQHTQQQEPATPNSRLAVGDAVIRRLRLAHHHRLRSVAVGLLGVALAGCRPHLGGHNATPTAGHAPNSEHVCGGNLVFLRLLLVASPGFRR